MLLDGLEPATASVSEEELLASTHWAVGEDARLREDERFRETPWGRWIRADRYLANEEIVRRLRQGEQSELDWVGLCADLGRHMGLMALVCTADPRLRFVGERVRLTASELSDEPLLEDALPLEQYSTHLPVVSLEAAAASEPAGDWGSGAPAQVVEPRGWLRVELDRPLNPRMFIARLRGSSMDDGRSRLTHGAWVVFEFAFHEGVAFDAGDQRPNVLVRGDFYDGDTGTYAVKRWDRDAHAIRLHSLNPDRRRYPEIVVDEAELDTVRIIATVSGALASSQFGRRPRPKRRTGYRPIASDLPGIGRQLASSARAFFEGLPPPLDDEDAELTGEWTASLVCLAVRDGGPHLEIGPLRSLPSFVKRLRAHGVDGTEGTAVAANARFHPLRLPVAPARGPWHWSAVGFEEELASQMAPMRVEVIDPEAITPFRVGSDGVGRRTNVVTLGEHHRLLIPPSLDLAEGESVGEGWRVWELTASEDEPEVLRRLRELGVAIGTAQIALTWSLPLPDHWRRTERGEEYACFPLGTAPTARIETSTIVHAGDAVAVLVRAEGDEGAEPDGHVSVPLPASASSSFILEDLAPGRYVLAVVHRRVGVRRARLCFAMTQERAPMVSSAWSLWLNGEERLPAGATRLDLRALDLARDDAVVLRGPPGWPVAMTWSVLQREYLGTVSLGADGVLDALPLLEPIEERRRRDRLGDWELDLGELGAITLQHQRTVTPESIRAEVGAIVERHRSLVEASDGAFSDLLRLFVGPICSHLGYEHADEASPLVEGPFPSVTRHLTRCERGLLGIEPPKPIRLLVLAETIDDCRTDRARTWIDARCKTAGVREAIVTTGRAWTTHRVGSAIARRVHDVFEALSTEDTWRSFLQDLAEGV